MNKKHFKIIILLLILSITFWFLIDSLNNINVVKTKNNHLAQSMIIEIENTNNFDQLKNKAILNIKANKIYQDEIYKTASKKSQILIIQTILIIIVFVFILRKETEF